SRLLSFIMSLCFYFFFLIIPHPPISTLFPYTTLFRSRLGHRLYLQFNPVLDAVLDHNFVCAFVQCLLPTAAHTKLWSRTASKTRSEEHTSELQSRFDLVCRLLLEKKKKKKPKYNLLSD